MKSPEPWRSRTAAPLPDSMYQVASFVPSPARMGSTHALGLGDAVEFAHVLDRLPSTLTIIGIEGADFTTGEGMSPEVEKAGIKVTDDLAQRLGSRPGRLKHGFLLRTTFSPV